MAALRDYNGFIFDLDGVIYRGDRLIHGAVHCLDALERYGKRYVFATNHTKRTSKDVVAFLSSLGLTVDPGQVVTANQALLDYIGEHSAKADPSVYLIGWGGIFEDFADAGIRLTDTRPDYVVVAWDPDCTYDKIRIACDAVLAGATLLVSSPDRLVPAALGVDVGMGAFGAAISYATGKRAVYAGKPYPPMIHRACRLMGTTLQETLIVGDTPESDLHARTICGLGGSILVLSGNTSLDAVPGIPIDQTPTYVVQSVEDIAELLAAELDDPESARQREDQAT